MTTRFDITEVWFTKGSDHKECHWAKIMAAAADEQVERFGASDCRCLSHLFYFEQALNMKQFVGLVSHNQLSKNCSEIKIQCYLPERLSGS
jgi:Uri superfamily endonuclease